MEYNIALVGEYPAQTFETFSGMLPVEKFNIIVVDTQEKYDVLTNADIIILRVFKAPEEVMMRNPNLKMIMRWGAGFDSVDIEAAGKRGIIVTNTPGANAYAVSELTVLLMLAVGRKLLCHTDYLHKGEWSKNTFLDQTKSLHNKLVGIIGGGNIGCQVAQKVQVFGARVQYSDAFRLTPEAEEKINMQYVSFEEIIATSDIITLHVPLTESTRHILGEKQFASMKKGAIVINAARGGLADDKALLASVQSGHLAGAGIDCVEYEPLSADDPLLHNPNIIITPHVGGGTSDIGNVIVPMLVQDIMDYVNNKEVSHIVNGCFLASQVSGT